MIFEDIYDLSDTQIKEVVEQSSADDLFKALIVQANVVVEKLKPFLQREILEQILEFKKRPYAIPVSEVEASTERIVRIMDVVLRSK